jgi:hypothetical protein
VTKLALSGAFFVNRLRTSRDRGVEGGAADRDVAERRVVRNRRHRFGRLLDVARAAMVPPVILTTRPADEVVDGSSIR